ncbi:ATP phosphoribosyltransferase [Carnobacterium iners]|uniref:ATP phosphoribosyltransferase n=1 Tax=Carnobacterium iners TaxID=1073423 RepID=A0A1X7MWE5_9LACT|nr:ATP phosphoribosyltransferase [Carnobacterium iners]SEK17756.1 ATP phosphoribosyltransferase [Carnobacterium iners]SMH29133.1 ATP phosphoribosyltransferase [Carnobacterium iners]
METLTIAIAKGRLGKKGLKLFEETEYAIEMEEDSRKLIFNNANKTINFIFVKPCDVVTYVEKGVADMGIVGRDTILEENKDIYEVLDLKYGKCKFVVAGFENQDLVKKNEVLKIATKYPSYVYSIFEDRGQKIEIIKLGGAIELAPLMGLSEVIVDIVETGTTLKDNGLVVLEELDPISARLIVNKVSYRFNYEEIQKIEKVLGERR